VAGTSLLALIDDVATILDDVAVLTKVAAKKTTGVLGDDLALNAQQVAGVSADRELPVVYAVAKGSAINKIILVPVALAISAFFPWAITPLLMVGGLFLCFEGFEKIFEKFFHHSNESLRSDQKNSEFAEDHRLRSVEAPIDLAKYESEKIKGAVRTDFILSAEIIVITLGSVANEVLSKQVLVLIGISALMTVGVYGLVAAIVKIDDLGLWLYRLPGDGQLAKLRRVFGSGLLSGAPYLMKALGIAGTVAMFLVGGGIVAHAIPLIHLGQTWIQNEFASFPSLAGMFYDGLLGVVSGGLVLLGLTIGKAATNKFKKP
jgi:uncharacterized protein